MQFIRDIYAQSRVTGRPVISYEFFTPKTDEGDRTLQEKTIPELFRFKPDYCSVTYGAGGSTRTKTLSLVDWIQRRQGVTAMAHLTCVGASRAEVKEIIVEARDLGIRNLLALRGDPPPGASFQPVEGGMTYAYELVEMIRNTGGFSIGVAGFPEGHIACEAGKLVDWQRLRAKIDTGADFVVSQLFFDNADFLEFRDHLTKRLGVTVPIVPGILPILSGRQVKRFTEMCRARLPETFRARLDELGDDDAAVTEFGIEHATKQCQGLLAAGVPGLHFYTLNKSHSTLRILADLGWLKQ